MIRLGNKFLIPDTYQQDKLEALWYSLQTVRNNPHHVFSVLFLIKFDITYCHIRGLNEGSCKTKVMFILIGMSQLFDYFGSQGPFLSEHLLQSHFTLPFFMCALSLVFFSFSFSNFLLFSTILPIFSFTGNIYVFVLNSWELLTPVAGPWE